MPPTSKSTSTSVRTDVPTVLPDAAVVRRDVEALLAAQVDTLAEQWAPMTGHLGVDVLPQDLPRWLGDLLVGHGKRLRVTLAHAGFVAGGGVAGDERYDHLVRAAAALETLHLFALLHDDVMDESDSRRGRPAAHVEAEAWHRDAGAVGDRPLFGRNLAILLGDLAHTLADRLADGLPPALRQTWYELCIELIAGQRADLTAAAAGRRDLAHAEHVARVKSGRYTVTRPLQLGALAAGAEPPVVETLMECGDLLGRAFALRDDALGVWGDPALTGKPAGDDLFEAKATVLLAIARQRLTGPPADALARLGTPGFTRDEVAGLAEAMCAAGVESQVEVLIADTVQRAMAVLHEHPLPPAGLALVESAATRLAWRQS